MKWLPTISMMIVFLTMAAVGYVYVAWNETVEPSGPVQAPVVVQPSKYEIGPADPQEILELVNAERKKVGVAPLVMHDSLNKSAQLKADDMWNRDYRGHYLPEDPNATLTLEMSSYVEPICESSSKNFVFGESNGYITTQTAFNWWMNPPAQESNPRPSLHSNRYRCKQR